MIGAASQSWADWNFHAGELDIVRRIKEVTQSGPGAWARIVGTREDLEAIQEDQQVTPGVYVVYAGAVFKDSSVAGATVQHQWRVVLAISSKAPGREASPRNQIAGKFLPGLLLALHGFTPEGSTTPLVPVTPPPIFPSGNFTYYPLAFTSDCVYSTRKGPAIGPMASDRRFPNAN